MIIEVTEKDIEVDNQARAIRRLVAKAKGDIESGMTLRAGRGSGKSLLSGIVSEMFEARQNEMLSSGYREQIMDDILNHDDTIESAAASAFGEGMAAERDMVVLREMLQDGTPIGGTSQSIDNRNSPPQFPDGLIIPNATQPDRPPTPNTRTYPIQFSENVDQILIQNLSPIEELRRSIAELGNTTAGNLPEPPQVSATRTVRFEARPEPLDYTYRIVADADSVIDMRHRDDRWFLTLAVMIIERIPIVELFNFTPAYDHLVTNLQVELNNLSEERLDYYMRIYSISVDDVWRRINPPIHVSS